MNRGGSNFNEIFFKRGLNDVVDKDGNSVPQTAEIYKYCGTLGDIQEKSRSNVINDHKGYNIENDTRNITGTYIQLCHEMCKNNKTISNQTKRNFFQKLKDFGFSQPRQPPTKN